VNTPHQTSYSLGEKGKQKHTHTHTDTYSLTNTAQTSLYLAGSETTPDLSHLPESSRPFSLETAS